ncbi:MAG: hypothetical protein JWR38_556 [Mucilaginibacter sp.]|nr:hypothetical protein [Mucilaginibacter sp.]
MTKTQTSVDLSMTHAIQPVKPGNYITKLNGKMMKVVDGIVSPMTKPVILTTGVEINIDGSVNLPNGKTAKMKENLQVTMSGNFYGQKNN